MTSTRDDSAYIEQVKARAEELERVLGEFSDRLRRMRERNRRAQQENMNFQKALDELHEWLGERL
jgi:hypothetical protein